MLPTGEGKDMHWEYALIGLLLINAFLMAKLSYQSAKNKTDRQASVVLVSIVLSVIFFPAAWAHCWYWAKRLPDKGFIKFD